MIDCNSPMLIYESSEMRAYCLCQQPKQKDAEIISACTKIQEWYFNRDKQAILDAAKKIKGDSK